MKKMIKSLANKAICAAFVVLGAASACAEVITNKLYDAVNTDVEVGYEIKGLADGRETAVVFTKDSYDISWTVPATLENVQFLVVGGGGGGGGKAGSSKMAGAGGGGGGVVTGGVKVFRRGDVISIGVGAGGKGGMGTELTPAENSKAESGVDSVFKVNDVDYITAYGGGGCGGNTSKGVRGGSNSGARNSSIISDEPKQGKVSEAAIDFCYNVVSYGNKGGKANASNSKGAGGGGGATGPGEPETRKSNVPKSGKGGPGLESDITGLIISYGAGGGGGATKDYQDESGQASGGAGRGGRGTIPAEDALANQGGGGGGGSDTERGGNGGSGIVVFRYVEPVTAVAQIGEQTFETLEAAFEAAQAGETIMLLSDATWTKDYGTSAPTAAAAIDLDGKTLTIVDGLIRFSTITIKNGNIVIDPTGSYTGNGVFYMFGENVLTLDNVKLTAENFIGYSIFCMEGNSDLVLKNNSEITVRNATTGFYGIIVAVSDGQITIENSKVIGDNISRGFQNGNYTIKGSSEITFTGVIKDGIFIGAGDSLKILDNANVNITLNPDKEGRYGINLDASATYEKAETATVVATDNIPKEVVLAGAGTEAEPYLIKNIDDLVLFRDSVNAGETKYSAPGVWVALAADIDMAGVNWVGIGSITQDHGFMGNFDGKTFKIKNLTINNPTLNGGYAYAGFFGITEGTETAQNIIKNLTIDNVTINTTGQIVSAAIAYPYYTIVENVKVLGDINITGGNYTAGALAYTRRCVNASNVSVVGNAGSTITGGQAVGGVISDIQMNGGLIANYSNFAAENLTISGTKMVGGISGIIATQMLDGATVKDVTINCADRAGQVAGSFGGTSTISNIVVENVTGAAAIIGGGYDGSNPVEAKLGDTFYSTFAEAYAAAKADDTITLLRDVTLTGKLSIAKSVTIDGNGHSIVANHTAFILETSSDCEFKNITLNTNNKAKGVKIASGNVTFDNVTIPNSNKSDAITVVGTLTIKNYFKVESTYQVFDARSGSIYVEEGTVFDFTSRIGLASPADDDLKAAVDTNGKPYFCAYGSTTYYRTLTSIAGTITDLTLLDDVSLNKDITVKGTLNLNGKTLTLAEGKVLKTGGNLTITGGAFANPILLTSASYTVKATDGLNVITNVEGKKVVYENGVYKLVDIVYAAQIGEQKYETLASALAAAQNDAVVELLWAEGNAPIAMNGSVFGKSVTITGTATVDWSKGFLFVGRGGEGNGTVIFDNANLESASNNASYGIHVSGREKETNNKYDGTVVINNSTIVLDYLIDKGAMTMTNSTLTVKNGFAVGGRPASETESGADATATFDLTNGSTLIVNNHNGMGLGYEAIGVMTIDSTSTFECTQSFLVTDKGVLKSAGNVFGDIVKSDNAQIELTGGIYTDEEVQGWCADGYVALRNFEDQYVVGVAPTAEVENFGATTVAAGGYTVVTPFGGSNSTSDPMELPFVMKYVAVETPEAGAASPYADWYGDFVITFTGLKNGSISGAGCYLAGHYGTFGWVKVPVDNLTIENGVRYPVMLSTLGNGQKYDYICSGVDTFLCAMYLPESVLAENPDLKVSLELCVVDNSNGPEAAQQALATAGSEYTYQSAVEEFEVEDFEDDVQLPEVAVVDIKSSLKDSDPDLTFALNFKIKDMNSLTDEYLEKLFAKYGNYYTDYVLTISGLSQESVTFNANGGADGYLAGQYDAWSENWVSVPFSDVTIQNGQSLYIMEYAAQLMGKQGLRFTLAEVAEIVQNFDCGVYFTPDFLAANPNLKVDLELKVFTEDANGNKVNDITVAKNEFTKANFGVAAVVAEGKQTQYFTSLADAVAAADGKTVRLLSDVELTDGIVIETGKNVTIDLAGFDITRTVGDVTANTQVFLNNGTLTITDSADEDGEISLTYTGDRNGNVTISTIRNYGVLNVVGGTVNCNSGNQAISYAIDAFSPGTVNISGGKVTGGASGYCIRMFLASTTSPVTLNVTGGEVGYVWAQQTNENANKGVINVEGGKVDYVYIDKTGSTICDASNVSVSIKTDATTYEPHIGEKGHIAIVGDYYKTIAAIALDIRIVDGKPQIGYVGNGTLVLEAAVNLTGEWTKNISYTAVENDGDDAKTWVTPQEGYFFFKGFITK